MKEFLEYYEKVKSDKVHIIDIDNVKFLIKEITWKEGLLIDAKSFRKKDNVVYQNTEFEKREILNIAILSAYNSEDGVTFFPEYNKSLIDFLDHTIVEKLWVQYQNYLYLSADEANFYYISAKKYFNPNDTETYPVPPIIVEIDYMLRGLVSFGRDEFSKLSMKEFETMQLILATKNESKQKSVADIDIDTERELR